MRASSAGEVCGGVANPWALRSVEQLRGAMERPALVGETIAVERRIHAIDEQ